MQVPNITVRNPPETRVGDVLDLYQTLLANKYLHENMVRQKTNKDFEEVYNKLSQDDWETMRQIEGVTRNLKSYVVGEAQTDNANNNSLTPFYRKCL